MEQSVVVANPTCPRCGARMKADGVMLRASICGNTCGFAEIGPATRSIAAALQTIRAAIRQGMIEEEK